MDDQFAAGLIGKSAPVGWMEIGAQGNKHKDCNQVGKSGECLVVDEEAMVRFCPSQDFVPILSHRELQNLRSS